MMERKIQKFLSSDEKKKKILSGEAMPVSYFSANKKRKYIVDAYGTIYGKQKKNKETDLIP